jgi:sec-independent protein translocase protein TatA
MSMPGLPEILIILLVILLLFGTKRLPDIGRALGEGIREFKKALKQMGEDEGKKKKKKD